MSKFFIDRPIFATVVSIVILLSGLIAMRVLPIAQYPEIVPPEVVVTATYPGGSAQTIAETVAAPLEQQINGVEGMIYMQSTSNGSGSMTLSVLFTSRTNPDQASINVNNRVQRALPLLPEEVRRQGVTVTRRSLGFSTNSFRPRPSRPATSANWFTRWRSQRASSPSSTQMRIASRSA